MVKIKQADRKRARQSKQWASVNGNYILVPASILLKVMEKTGQVFKGSNMAITFFFLIVKRFHLFYFLFHLSLILFPIPSESSLKNVETIYMPCSMFRVWNRSRKILPYCRLEIIIISTLFASIKMALKVCVPI